MFCFCIYFWNSIKFYTLQNNNFSSIYFISSNFLNNNEISTLDQLFSNFWQPGPSSITGFISWAYIGKKWNLSKVFNENHIQYLHWVMKFSEKFTCLGTNCQFVVNNTHNSFCTACLGLYLVTILVSVENAVSHKYVVAKVSCILDHNGYSKAALSQNSKSSCCLNWIFIGVYS